MKTQSKKILGSLPLFALVSFFLLAAAPPPFPAGPPAALPPPRPPSPVCGQIMQNAVANAPANNAYLNPVLNQVHNQLYRFNTIETSDVEMILCQFVNQLGMNPDLSQLPQTVTKMHGSDTFVLNVTSPTEDFAVAAGYVAKAVVTFDGSQFLAMWWAGSGTSSKGYLIEGANPVQQDGMTRIKYLLWDRSGEAQVLKIFGAQFDSANGYLQTPAGAPGSVNGGDNALFARETYNTSTGAIAAQSVEIHAPPGGGSLSCVKTEFGGTLTGLIDAYRPAMGTPAALTNADVTGADSSMDGVTGITDSASTAANAGTPVTVPITLPIPLDYSCLQLKNADQAGGVFAGDTVNYSMLPSTVFPN